MVAIWDVVGFDEVADLQKMPKEVITTMKTYCALLQMRLLRTWMSSASACSIKRRGVLK